MRPHNKPDAHCAAEAEPMFFTPEQLISLPARTRGGSASVQDHLLALAGPALVVAAALALLFSAVPVYSITEIVRVFRSRGVTITDAGSVRLVAAAPLGRPPLSRHTSSRGNAREHRQSVAPGVTHEADVRRRIDPRTGKVTMIHPESFWHEHEQRRLASGLSIGQYCERHELAKST